MLHGLLANKKLILTSLVLIVGAFIVLAIVNRSPRPLTGDEKAKQTIAKISRHYLLPADETPALATVTNSNKLTSQFLKKAENGDEVLIYKDNELAIIYRPTIDRIVGVGPVKLDATAPYSGQ